MTDINRTVWNERLLNACNQATPVYRPVAEDAYRKLYFNRKNLEIHWFDSLEELCSIMPVGAENYIKFRTIIKGGGPHVGLTVPHLNHADEYQLDIATYYERNNHRSGPYSACFVLARLIYGLLLVPYELSDWGKLLATVATETGHHFVVKNQLFASERQVLKTSVITQIPTPDRINSYSAQHS
jgi:hypothetical protein